MALEPLLKGEERLQAETGGGNFPLTSSSLFLITAWEWTPVLLTVARPHSSESSAVLNYAVMLVVGQASP